MSAIPGGAAFLAQVQHKAEFLSAIWTVAALFFAAVHPALYRPMARLASRVLRWAGRKQGRISSLPLAGGWTATRDIPAPSGPTFKERWQTRTGPSEPPRS